MNCLQIQLQVDGIVSEGNTVAVRYTERGKSRSGLSEAPGPQVGPMN